MQSPIDIFSSLTDPRMDRCKLHKLCDILFITIAACFERGIRLGRDRRVRRSKAGVAIRENWAIENQLQWTLDVAFVEDKSQKRASYNFSLINKITLNVLKNEKSKKRRSMKVKRHTAGWDNDYVFQLLDTAKEL